MENDLNTVTSAIDALDRLSEIGDVSAHGYDELFWTLQSLTGLQRRLDAAEADIAALLWLNGSCEYCAHGEKVSFSGAARWRCKLESGVECCPEWRGLTPTSKEQKKAPEPTAPDEPNKRTEPRSRVERVFGPKETWKMDMKTQAAAPESYKGFLLIQCRKCGKIRGFCTKTIASETFCECGEVTPFHDMKRLTLECKCGKRFRYMTNVKADTFSYNCLACGSPVDLVYNRAEKRFETLR